MVWRMAPRWQHEDVTIGASAAPAPPPPPPPPSPRVVLHIDLDAFFVQVERSLNPTLIGKPMCVFQHADVIAVSYEARKLGVTKHMPTTTIRREHPSVKLVHVQTIGLQNDKVSYRNYRAAARAIFTLIQAFCPAEDDPNGTGSRGGAGGPKHQNASAVKARRGIFQKASVDEAYLEPTRRTLMAELLLSSERENKTPGTAAERSNSTDRAPTAAELLTAGAKRPRRTESSVGGVPSSANHAEEPWRHGGGDGRDQALSGSGQDSTENQNRLYTPDEIEGDVEAGYDSVGDDGHQNGFGRPRRSGSNARTESIEEEEEAQLLEAGGLLGIRIQKTLRDVLKYDCSVGVAGNKFLAKLATNLAKPRGVCVLRRRDVSALLAATPATKIPGCGAGSAAAKQFAAWGAKTVLDLRRIDAPEMRQHLGEQQGKKVFDRCRGIDNDPVEPDPIPSRVSSQMSLVPLISPARCLGKPGEKLTPVFPWEVERVKPFLVTLVDDLMDRMKEEVVERHRRPTKLCIEHHLFHRGSKSQTFALPSRAAHRPHPLTALTTPIAEGVGDRTQRPEETPAPTAVAEDKNADSSDLLGLPLAASLVELVLAPFRSYRNSRQAMAASDGAEAQRRRATEGGRADTNRRGENLPPVVKLIVTLLGFESVGPTPPTAAPPGQQTLRGMMWLKKDDAAPRSPEAMNRPTEDTTSLGGETSPPRSGRRASEESSAAEVVAPSPVPEVVPMRSPSKCAVVRARDVAGPRQERVRQMKGVVGEEGSVLVRCPSCKACLPVGTAWDAHREEHMSGVAADGRSGPTRFESSRGPAVPHQAAALPLLPSEADAPRYPLPDSDHNACVRLLEPRPRMASLEVVSAATAGEQEQSVEGNAGNLGGKDASGGNTASPKAAVRSPVRDMTAESGDCPGDRARSRKFSELLMLAVSPDQAADVLRQRGFLADDRQTRFANVCTQGGQHRLE